MITSLNELFLQHEGNCPIHFTVYDPLDDVEVRMPSKSIKVDLNNKLFKGLQKLDLEVIIK